MSKLTDIIALLYRMDEADTAKTARQLTERRRATWINTLSDLARQHGCNQLAGTPKGEDARKFKDDSQADADSITNTFNRELENAINRLYKDNPKGNRTYYTSNLAKWKRARDGHKIYSIGLNTDTDARQYAFSRFYVMNKDLLSGGFVAAGPPAVCEKCLRVFAAGIVDLAYTQKHAFPLHYNCPHFYRQVAPRRVECAKLWVG